MTKLHSLLAVYGAIDQLIEHERSGLAATVEGLLPGTTGHGKSGWFRQIQALVNRLASDSSDTPFPDLSSALDSLSKAAVGFEGDAETLTIPDLARLMYAIGVLSRLPVSVLEREFFVTDGQLARVLCLMARLPGHDGEDAPVDKSDLGYELLATVRSNFISREQWRSVVETAREQGLVSDALASIGAPCTGAVKRVGADDCTRLLTDFHHPGLSVDAVKAIADPLNWPHGSAFFCRTTPLTPDVDAAGWSRILEEISTDCRTYRLKTALKYWKAEINGGAIINYDLDDNRANSEDSGLVRIDNGYIWITPIPGGGVRVRTSKEVLIEGVSATATAVLACVLGWADIGQNILLRTALRPPTGAVGWEPSVGNGIATPSTRASRTGPPTLPAGVRKSLVNQTFGVFEQFFNSASTFPPNRSASPRAAGSKGTPDD